MKKFFVIFLILSSITFSQKLPYTILVSFDGFRWDYLDRNLTPNIDKLINTGVRALSLRPSYPSKTFPNHLSIITGLYPAHHGIISNFFKDKNSGDIYKIGNNEAVKNSKWYKGEFFWETAEKQGITTASYFWPGSEVTLNYRKPSYVQAYEHHRDYLKRVNGVIDYLKMPYKKRPKFITLYFDATDTFGHIYGPNSEETNFAIARLDSMIGALDYKIDSLGLKDSLNIVIVSDHGMTEISQDRVINIEQILSGYKFDIEGTGPFMTINAEKKSIMTIFNKLKQHEKHYKVYLKENMPKYFHYSDNFNIYPIILVADLGWQLINNKIANKKKSSYSKGDHGYNNNCLDMHGIFVAKGPSFRKNFRTGTIWNVDIYPLLCKIYNLVPNFNIDGKLERIEFVLDNKE